MEETHDAVLARKLFDESVKLLKEGQYKEAAAVAKGAVRAFRQIAKNDEAISLGELAMNLDNLSIILYALGKAEESLSVANESVEIFWRIKDSDELYQLLRARCLNGLVIRLKGMGKKEEAIESIKKAIKICRDLSTQDNRSLLNLAVFLNNLAALVHGEEGIDLLNEAIKIWKKLFVENPTKFLPSLAGGLRDIAILLHEVGRSEEASAAARESLDILRKMNQN